MIRNYLLVAFRNLQRNTIYSFINVSGLAIGIACTVLIMLWVVDEVSYDKFHAQYDELYQVHVNQEFSGDVVTSNTIPLPLAEALKQKSSQIRRVAVTTHEEGFLLSTGENGFNRMAYAVGEDFLKMFGFKMISGSAETALIEPNSIVLTKSVAQALFGDEDPMNKLVKIENQGELKVTGVLEDVPAQSTLQFQFLIPFSYMRSTQEWVRESEREWDNNSFFLFVELQPGASSDAVDEAIKDVVKNNNQSSPTAQVFLHPMSMWRLYSEFTNGKISGGRIEYVQMFTAIAIFILVIACINFMNLATARSESRAREVGVRKCAGSRRNQLVVQFLAESILVTTIAFILAVVVAELVLPFFNMLVSKKLTIDYGDPMLWIITVAFVLFTGIISGSYPAFYLSGFRPVTVLKGRIQSGRGSVTPRKILVTIQFAFSIFLIIGTAVIYQQIMHVKARHVGYDRENLLLIWSTQEIEKNFQSLKAELKQSQVVESVCKSSAPITRIFSSSDNVTWPGKLATGKVAFTTLATEYDFTKTMGIRMLEGRDFSPEFKSDTSAVIINQAALDLMQIKNPLGEKIHIWGNDRTIIGVMENVVMESPYHPVEPLAMVLIPEWSSTISVRLKASQDISSALRQVEKVFKKFDPEHPMAYRFADAEFERKFTSLNLLSRLAWIFSLLAIIISSLGLFGLAAFTAEQRTKEVGIRKVLGASVSSLVLLISKDFSKLIVLAFVIAAPIAWWLLENFLQKYPYRIDIPLWVIALAGVTALTLTIVIVSTQAMKAASTNPVKSLRSE